MAGTEEGGAKSAAKQKGVKRPHYNNARRAGLAKLKDATRRGEALRHDALDFKTCGRQGGSGRPKRERRFVNRNAQLDRMTYDPETRKRRCCQGCKRIVLNSRSWVLSTSKSEGVTFVLHGKKVRAMCRRCYMRLLSGWLEAWLCLDKRPS